MEDYRVKGKMALKTVISNDKNISILEKEIYNISLQKSEKPKDEFYKSIIYEVIGDIILKNKLNNILENIKKNKIEWNHKSFDSIKFRQHEQDEFIVNPFEVEEGALECKKCGSKRTFSYSKQIRSADEPMTTFAQCISCKAKWTYNG